MDELLITLPSKLRSAAMAVRGCLGMLPMDRPPSPAVLSLLTRAALDLEGLVGQVETFSDRQRQIESDRRIASAKASMSRVARSVLKRRR
jgi:hypothetical protein